MHEAFELIRLVDKLPLKICALATWDDSFMLSTTNPKGDAHLLIYDIRDGKMTRVLKKFTDKPITQLSVVPEHRLLIALSDGELFCADLDSYTKRTISRTRASVSYFAVDWQTLRVQCDKPELRICVVIKKKLNFFEYKGGEFTPYKNEISLFDVPKAVAWVGKNVVVCIKKELHLINTDTGDITELFSIGVARTEPCLLQLIRGEILILKDELQVSIDQDGKPTQSAPINWSEPPIAVELVEPYIIGILPKGVEVRAFEQTSVVQLIRTNEVRLLASHKHTVIAESNVVYKLEPKSYDSQVQDLVKTNNFELALQIAGLIPEADGEKKQRRHDIVRKQAFYQFTQLEFEESLKNYLAIQEDPIRVIGLYPLMLSSELRSTLAASHPFKPVTLDGKELDDAMKHLQKYLTQLRYQETQKLQKLAKDGSSEEGVKKTLELIDTTLLKCYTRTNNSTLIGSLVRLPDNHLNLAECEKVLKAESKYQELVDLYQSKGQHEKALRLLKDFSKGPGSSGLSGQDPTIRYLQNLGKDNLPLILEYSKLVIKESPDEALHIFTEESSEVEGLPRDEVLRHLQQNASELVLPYLEHVINRWKDDTPLFHNTLLRQYTSQTNRLLDQYRKANQGRRPKAGEESGEAGKMRKKLLQFIESSKHYQPQEHVSSLPPGDMFEERALLLSRIGQHEVALAIYVHVLNDQTMAEEYCRKNYDAEMERNKDVYLSLLKMYMSPPDLEKQYGICPPTGPSRPPPNLKAAISVLTTYHCQIDTIKLSGQCKAERDQYKKDLGHTREELDEVRKELGVGVVIEVLADLHVRKERDQYEKDLGHTREELGEVRKELGMVREELSDLRNERDQYEKDLGHTREELGGVRKELGEVRKQLADLRKEHSTCKTFWIVPRHNVTLLQKSLGGGAWGYVVEGQFRGQQVAVKCIHEAIIAQHTIKRVYREICTMAQMCHPNLVQFIAAVLDDQGGPMIITELLDTTLRKAYGDSLLNMAQCMDILHNVASALRYLHELEAPIIHRDVSSANVLMKGVARDTWIAKLSDFGSANWARQACTMGEGAIVYTAPEAYPTHPSLDVKPPHQTTKIDVYSYGILVCEVTLREFPDPDHLREMKEKMKTKHVLLHTLVIKCTQLKPDNRPTMAAVLKELETIRMKL